MTHSESYRKFLAAAVTAAVVVTATAPIGISNPAKTEAAKIKFSDVGEQSFYTEGITYLVGKGILKGYDDGTFKPNQKVTRAEAAAMLAAALNLDVKNVSSPGFSDVKADQWYYGPVAVLTKAGIITGYENGTFQPYRTITRAEMAKLLVGAYESLKEVKDAKLPFTDVKNGAWYNGYIAALLEQNITTGKTAKTFAPNELVTRAEAATFLYRSEKVKDVVPEPDPNEKPNTDEIPPVSGGGTSGGGEAPVPPQAEALTPIVTTVKVSGVLLSGTGTNLSGTLSSSASIKEIRLDLNTASTYEITAVQDKNGGNLLNGMNGGNSGTLPAGNNQVIDLISVFGFGPIPASLVKEFSPLTIKVKMTNVNDQTKSSLYSLNITIN
jgi:hypothetical protein